MLFYQLKSQYKDVYRGFYKDMRTDEKYCAQLPEMSLAQPYHWFNELRFTLVVILNHYLCVRVSQLRWDPTTPDQPSIETNYAHLSCRVRHLRKQVFNFFGKN